MRESNESWKAPETITLEEAGKFNLASIKKSTKADLMGTSKTIGYKGLERELKYLGCSSLDLETIKELTKKNEIFTINTSMLEGKNILSIAIKCLNTMGLKLIIIQRLEYISIDPKTGERKTKYGFSIIG